MFLLNASISSLAFVQLSFLWTANRGLYIYPCCVSSWYVWSLVLVRLGLLGPRFHHQCIHYQFMSFGNMISS